MIGSLRQDVRLIGRSAALREIEAEIDSAARSDAKVMITGETGVGKEVVSRLIHQQSVRHSAGLVTLNCAGLPDSLLESELFGHTRGSFTGAYRDKPGLLEMAPNGTLFLDEVCEMSTRMQVVLLRFLETGEIQRIGADASHTRVNVRLITATNRDVAGMISAGTFREDLYFRLNVIRIAIPALRERADDIPVLIEYFLEGYCRHHKLPQPELKPDALDALVGYRWPGNIRELKNVVERVLLKTGGRAIGLTDLPPEVLRASAHTVTTGPLAPPGRPAHVEELSALMLQHGESFWAAVYPMFMSRDLTRKDLRQIIQIGLEHTNGNYRLLVQIFNMPPTDYKRFLGFLRKHDCHLPFQRFRVVPAHLIRPERRPQSA